MRYFTHAAAGLIASLFFVSYSNHPLLIVCGAVIGALLVDIDVRLHKVGRYIFPLNILTKHRGILHSALPIALLFALWLIYPSGLILGLCIGYLSHVMIDALTPAGIYPLYPFRLQLRGPIRTGSFAEYLVFVAFLGGLAILLRFRLG